MNIKSIAFLALIIGALNSPTSDAAVFKCKSADGKISFQSSACSKEQESIENKIATPKSKRKVLSSGASSIYGTWVEVKESNPGRMVISGTGDVEMAIAGIRDVVGRLSETGDNKYHIKADFNGLDMSSNLVLNPESGELSVTSGSSVESIFRKQ